MAVVLVTPPVLYQEPGPYSELLQRAGLEIRYPTPGGRQLTEAQLRDNLNGVDFCLAGSEPYTQAILESFPQLRVIARCGVGYDTVDMATATRLEKVVGFTPGANHDSVAEQTFALLLGIAKKVLENHERVLTGSFDRRCMQPVRNRTLGLIGLGRIGRAVAERARAFRMRVIGYDRFVAPAADDLIEHVPFERVLAESDYLSLHVPLTLETKEFINAETLAKMKKGVVLINTARGGIIREADLAAALASGHVAGAGLDVFACEPPHGSPLLTAPNVLFAPHIAGIDVEAVEAMATMAAQTIVDLYERRWPIERLVNGRELPPNWRWDQP